MVIDRAAARWIEVAHAENARRVERAHAVLEASGVLGRLGALATRPATTGELLLVHAEEQVERLRAVCEEAEAKARAGHPEVLMAGPEARAGAGSLEAALIAAGTAIEAVDHVLVGDAGKSTTTVAGPDPAEEGAGPDPAEEGAGREPVKRTARRESSAGPVRRAYSLTRPPGHHASADQAMGFCLFNSAAIAARHAQRHHGLRRVAVLDWDVHHGNGTQAVFYGDPSVLFISLHQDGLYPEDLGTVAERGEGDGLGANLNIPLPAGTGDAGYLAALEQVALPAIAAFEPELIVLSSGQDAGACDPLGRMSVTAEGFRAMTGGLVELAGETCDGRIVAIQEGGYSLDHMPFCVLATVEALAGLPPTLSADPVEMDVPTGIKPIEAEAIRAAAAAART
jgi:acetoin utilization deacetylase AcuC-like enzyme